MSGKLLIDINNHKSSIVDDDSLGNQEARLYIYICVIHANVYISVLETVLRD